jgi:hypothetical protein
LSISRINPPKFGGGLKSESDPRGIGSAFHGTGAGIGQKGTFFKGLSVDVHIHMMTHAIPNPFGITLPAMVVLTVNKVMFVVHGLFFTHPGPTMRTVNILNVFFFHENLNYSSRFMGLCMGNP